jgi:hypothetical protein
MTERIQFPLGPRGSGRTRKIVEEMAFPCTLVVHTPGMRYYMQQMIRDLRGEAADRQTDVIVIAKAGDAEKLRGIKGPIHFDHACFEELPSNVQRQEMIEAQEIARRINLEWIVSDDPVLRLLHAG